MGGRSAASPLAMRAGSACPDLRKGLPFPRSFYIPGEASVGSCLSGAGRAPPAAPWKGSAFPWRSPCLFLSRRLRLPSFHAYDFPGRFVGPGRDRVAETTMRARRGTASPGEKEKRVGGRWKGRAFPWSRRRSRKRWERLQPVDLRVKCRNSREGRSPSGERRGRAATPSHFGQ